MGRDEILGFLEAIDADLVGYAKEGERLDRMTVEEYEAMVASGAFTGSNRFHLINGYLVKKTTHHPPHAIADDLCGRELARVLPDGYIRPAKPIRLPGQDSEPEPDRCVVWGTIVDYDERHPGPEDIVLVVEVADSSLAEDRKLAVEVYGPAGIPVYWIVDVRGRRVEVYTGPGPQGYGPPEIFAEGQSVPVVIDGREAGRIAVTDILPPRRPGAKAEGNEARPSGRPRALVGHPTGPESGCDPFLRRPFSASPLSSGAELPLPGAGWADWDQAGRLVFARDGRLLAATVENGQLAERELLDLNANVPTEVEALESARPW